MSETISVAEIEAWTPRMLPEDRRAIVIRAARGYQSRMFAWVKLGQTGESDVRAAMDEAVSELAAEHGAEAAHAIFEDALRFLGWLYRRMWPEEWRKVMADA